MGSNPVIGNTVVNQAGIPMQYDFRDIYASILKDWFGVSSGEVQTLFEHSVTFYPLVTPCGVGINEEDLAKEGALIYPNPATSNATVRFTAGNEWVKIDIFDINSKHIAEVYDGTLSQGRHDIPMKLKGLPAGQYIVQIKKDSGIINEKLSKMK